MRYLTSIVFVTAVIPSSTGKLVYRMATLIVARIRSSVSDVYSGLLLMTFHHANVLFAGVL